MENPKKNCRINENGALFFGWVGPKLGHTNCNPKLWPLRNWEMKTKPGIFGDPSFNLGVSLNWPNHVISYSYQDVTHAAWSLGPLPLFDFFVVPSHSMQRYEEELLQRTNKHQMHQHQWWITSRIGGHGSILVRICCLFPWICADFHWLYIVIHPSFPSFPSPNASSCSMPLWRGTFLMGNGHYCILYWGCLVQSDFQLATIHKVHAVDDFCLSWCRPPFLKRRLGHENGPWESSFILKNWNIILFSCGYDRYYTLNHPKFGVQTRIGEHTRPIIDSVFSELSLFYPCIFQEVSTFLGRF